MIDLLLFSRPIKNAYEIYTVILSVTAVGSYSPVMLRQIPTQRPVRLIRWISASQDSSVKPQSNFYLFANGTWLKTTEIPPSQSSWGSFSILLDSSINRLHRILDSLVDRYRCCLRALLPSRPADLFVSAMDSSGIEKKGFSTR